MGVHCYWHNRGPGGSPCAPAGILKLGRYWGETQRQQQQPNAPAALQSILQVHDGQLKLEIRVANLRSVSINDAEVTIMMSSSYRVRNAANFNAPSHSRQSNAYVMQTAEGRVGYRGVELKPQRKALQSLHMMWNIYHVIDEASPLFGRDPEELTRDFTQVTATITGVDCAQEKPVRVTQAYGMGDIVFGGAFRDLLSFHQREQITCSERFFSTHPCGTHALLPSCCAGPPIEFHNVYSRMSTHLLHKVDGGERSWSHPVHPRHAQGTHSNMPGAVRGTPSTTATATAGSLNEGGGRGLDTPLLGPTP